MTTLLFWAAAATALMADAPRVIYTKSFPGSTPAFVSITVERSGAVAYKEAAGDDPETFQLEEEATAAIFDLAQKLDHFNHPIESGLKVANMGVKTFRWENGGEMSETKFNYSLDENAKALHDWFERITETERLLVEFRRAVRHDKLGVHQTLINVQSCWERKRLVGAVQFLPLLDRVAGNDTYLHMARERAAQLAEAIRAAGKAAPKS
ncbi:MAG: hypothetical protein DMG59_20370 [Acidobacteria bacterium]|nr:MAG: hypothetical protein DMG59_20370 [Acidobacteriota bacterium]